MGRGSQTADTASTTAQNNSNALAGKSNGIFSSLVPQLQTEAAHPAGFSPTDLASMNTHAMETAGGATAGATGRGALLAGRTRNAGTPAAAIADSARSGTETLARTGQDIDAQNAELKAKEQQAGLSGLQGIYGTDVSGGNTALGEVAPLVNADTNAENASWDAFNNITGAINAAGKNVATGMAGGCWIAEAIYGLDDPRTHLVRAWLNGPFRETIGGNLVMSVYLAVGQQIAWVARRSSWLRSVLKPLFDLALNKARRS